MSRGRPRKFADKLVRVNVMLAPEQRRWLKAQAGGMSAALRGMIEHFAELDSWHKTKG